MAIIDALKTDFKSRNFMGLIRLAIEGYSYSKNIRLVVAGKIRDLGKKIKFIL